MYFKTNDGSQNKFVYQSPLYTLESKKYKGTDYALSWKSEEVHNPELQPLCTAFLHSMKISGYRMGIKFDKDPLVVEQNNYLTKTVIVDIAHDLDAWPRYPSNNFKFENCLFGETSIIENSDKEK